MKIDLDELERIASAAEQDEWQWRPYEPSVLEGKLDGQVIMYADYKDGFPREICSESDRAHIAAASPPVVRGLIEHIRKLHLALGEACNHLVMATKLAKEERLLDVYEAAEEFRWIREQRELIAKGVETVDYTE